MQVMVLNRVMVPKTEDVIDVVYFTKRWLIYMYNVERVEYVV